MRCLKIKPVPRSKQVGGHHRNEVGVVLLMVKLAQFDTGNFGDCIGLIGRLKGLCEKIFLSYWLRTFSRIDAGTSEKEEL